MKLPSPEAMNEINEFALKSIQQKFPNMNIGRKEDEPQAEQAE